MVQVGEGSGERRWEERRGRREEREERGEKGREKRREKRRKEIDGLERNHHLTCNKKINKKRMQMMQELLKW
jgi:hypothetical protein